MDYMRYSMARSQGGQAVSEYEHNEHLLDEIQRLRESNFHLSKDCEEQKQRIKSLIEAGNELRDCAYRIGTVASDEASVIRRTQKAIEEWNNKN